MMRPLPVLSSCARLTLLPGEFSARSTLGIESPALTMMAAVDEKYLGLRVGCVLWNDEVIEGVAVVVMSLGADGELGIFEAFEAVEDI